MSDPGAAVAPVPAAAPPAIGELARRVPPIGPQVTCGEALARLMQTPSLPGLAVVAQRNRRTRLLGLISRETILRNFVDPLRHALFERRPVVSLMNRRPLTVEAETPLARVAERISTETPAALLEGFLVVRDGSYLGVGAVLDIMNRSVEIQRSQIAELTRARAAAESANASKALFLANLSHELRTPLNAVIGFSELLQAGVGGRLNARQREYVADIHGSGTLLLALINDLLDLSRADSGHLVLNESEFDLNELAAGVVRTLRPAAAKRKVTLALALPPEPIVLSGDRRLLAQLLLNLGGNAVKFTEPGGRIDVRAGTTADGCVELRVEDDGIGIEEAEQERVFEPFGRSRAAVAGAVEGVGLGLALCRAIAVRHGGEIRLASAPGVGTAVSVLLPAERLLPSPST